MGTLAQHVEGHLEGGDKSKAGEGKKAKMPFQLQCTWFYWKLEHKGALAFLRGGRGG